MCEKVITDEQFDAAFARISLNCKNARKAREYLLESLKTALVGGYSGSLLTDITLNLGLTEEPHDIGSGSPPKLTQKGYDFIVTEARPPVLLELPVSDKGKSVISALLEKQLAVRIEIKENIAPSGKWHWYVIFCSGHIYATSETFESAELCMADASGLGMDALHAAEGVLYTHDKS